MGKLRPYKETDKDSIIDIYTLSKMDELINEQDIFEFLPLVKDKTRYKKLFESDIFVYEEEAVVGYCAYHLNEIRALYTSPTYRGRGIGKYMFEYMLGAIKGEPYLFVARSNDKAKTIYKNYGFVIVDEFQTKYNGKAVFANKMKQLLNEPISRDR